jgi:hypothetical protein
VISELHRQHRAAEFKKLLITTDKAVPAEQDVVLGVDTHKDVHVAAMLSVVGVLLGSAMFRTTAVGYRQLLAWARGFGPFRQAGVEGTGSYGKALTRFLHGEGVEVTEVNSPDKASRRRRGARPVPSMPRPPPARSSAAAPAPRPRPATGRWRLYGCSSWPRHPPSSPALKRSTSSSRSWWALTLSCASR